ncbi:ribosome maturation factor RimM [Clostridia bacterium OttesenSCG-928-F22]|nr:ribosome maturation factor RimM [Clostridia bacterium OttesenSCG-928-F22]
MEYIKIGLVVKVHGVKGMLRIYPLTDDINRFKQLKQAYLMQDEAARAVELTGVSIHGNMVHMALAGVESREEAQKLLNAYICVRREDAVKLPADSYFISDLIGCTVCDENGRQYGVVKNILQTGANDVYVVEGQREYLMPAIKKLVSKVDVQQKQITIDSQIVGEVVADAD